MTKIRLSLLLCFFFAAVSQIWASGKQYMSATTADPAQGLVYMQKNNASSIADGSFKRYSPGGSLVSSSSSNTTASNNCYTLTGTTGCGSGNMYFWARPARGYVFKSWTGYAAHPASSTGGCNTSDNINPGPWTGTADLIHGTAGGSASTWVRCIASFTPATKYTITYQIPVGGSYAVNYSYLKTQENGTDGTTNNATEYKFYTATESYNLLPSDETNQEVTSYAADAVTLSTTAANFIGWFEDGTQKSTSKNYTYPVTKSATISARFKIATLGEPSGDLSPVVKQLSSTNKSITVPVTAIGTWSASDFTVTFTEKTNPKRNDITKGTVTYSSGALTIPYIYNPSSWGGTEIEVTVTPAYGDPITFTILASAVEEVTYEACIIENGTQTFNGTLAEMVAKANTLNSKPTIKLMVNKTISSPLSLTKSMTFDFNDKTITCTAASAFSIDAADIEVKIEDGGFSQVGTIAVESSQSGTVSVVTFTQKAKLTMNGGTLSAKNTGSGAAYGLDVRNGSVFYMTNGKLTVNATEDARGVNVATTSDYATFNGGSVTVTAAQKAYGLWSAGQGNITNATVNVETTTGAEAYGVYVQNGVSTLTDVLVTSTAKTTNAYGGYVNAGRLNVNGGSLTVSATTSDVYGVHIKAGATASVQQNTVVTAEATGATGKTVIGINNLGTASLANITLTAVSPTTDATAVNIGTGALATTIDGGSYTARPAGGTGYGLHHQAGTLSVDGGVFRAIGSGSNMYGVRTTMDATISDATLYAETQGSGNTAYGFVGATTGKNITLTNCQITGQSSTNKAYAIYSRANVTASGCTLTATTVGADSAYGFYAENGDNTLTNCNATVSSHTTTAYGINHVAGNLTVNGGVYDVTAEQITASAAQNSVIYGVFNAAGKTTTVNNATFNVTASNNAYSQSVFGAYINGTLNSSNTTYKVKGRATIRGIYGHSASTLNLSGNTVNAEATNGADCQGVYATKNFTIDGDIVSAKVTTTNVYAMYFNANAVGEVLDGKFSAVGNGTNGYGPVNTAGGIGKVVIKGGVYVTSANLVKYLADGYSVFNMDGTHPDYAAGYRYAVATENPSRFVCRIVGGNYYETLEGALQYTKDNSGSDYTIVMTQPYTLPAGDYVLPSNATLLVPYTFSQTSIAGAVPIKIKTAGVIEEHLCLTFAAGANLNVDGKIEVGGEMYCQEGGHISYNNSPYGRIHLEEGSIIQLNSGAYLYAWGYISGKGNIIAKNNSEVHEMFHIGDMKSMSSLAQAYIDNSADFFPVQQYYIQNIEAPTTYYYNSRLITAMSNYYDGVYGNGYNGDNNIKLVGTSGSLFLITDNDESSWVRKSYDPTTDYQVWEVNSGVKLGSLSMSVSSYTMNSANYILPLTSNFKIHILDGDFSITQSSQILPGASIEIDKTASLTINANQSLYVFDKDQWPFSISTIAYSPGWKNGTKPSRSTADVALNVHGKVDVKGNLYTSKSIASGTNSTFGANIFSTNADAGTIYYTKAASTSTATVNLVTGTSGSSLTTRAVTMEAAQLKNGNGTYTSTSDAGAGYSYVYMNDSWVKSYTNGCFEVIGSKVYAKPAEYVELKNTQTVSGKLTGVENADHTYTTVEDKLLILQDDCQWWEVEATADPTVFECKKAGYEGFYYYNTSTGSWEKKTVTVTFYSAETGNTVLKTITTDWKGVPDQSVIATNPTKATTAAATYQFYGWKSSVTGTEYKWTATLEEATQDMNYRPVFTETPRHYTITLKDAYNGTDVALEVAYGETPAYTAVKAPTAQYTYTFTGWNPTLTTVTGTKTYTAQWTSTVNKYTITWKNGDEVIETDLNQSYGSATAFNSTLPTKEADDQYAYTFSGWKSSLTGQTYNNGSTPAVAGETTYEAQYSTTPRYAVTFANYDGSQLARTIYTQGETPVFSGTPTRPRDYDGYFVFTGWKNSAGTFYATGSTLPSVTAKETYTAQYSYVTDLFTITLNNVDGEGASWSGKFGVGSIPFYNKNNDDIPVDPEKAPDATTEYIFDGWSLTSGGSKLASLPQVTAEATYFALFRSEPRKYTVIWKNYNGVVLETDEKVPVGTTPTYDGAEPTKPADASGTYEFTGWNPEVAAVTGDAEYTATFAKIGPKYTIIWKDADGTVLETDNNVPENTIPTYDGATPVKAADAQYTYTFSGWTPSVVSAVANATYTATYTQTVNTYTITWQNADGTILKTDENVAYGTTPSYTGAQPVKPADAQYSYTFSGWSPAITSVVGNVTYIATYTQSVNTYTVVWKDEDGTVLETDENVPYGSTPTYNAATPQKASTAQYSYSFSGWNPNVAAVAGDVVYTAMYTQAVRTYTVIWQNENGTQLEKDENVPYGTTPAYNGSTPAKESTAQYSYTFSSWSPAVVEVTEDATYTATFTSQVRSYAITFVDEDGTTVISAQTLDYGAMPTAPADPQKPATAQYTYTFSGWNPTVATVTGVATYTATYTQTVNNYTVIWKDADGTVLETDTDVPYGTMPTYDGTAPYKAPDAQYTYAFAGWEPEITAVAGNVTYTATYSQTVNKYTIIWKNYDGTVLETDSEVEYGATPTYNGVEPTKPSTATHYYTFSGWNPTISAVSGNAEYIATFDEHEIIDVVITTVAEDNKGTITGGGTYQVGQTATLTVTPISCYKFTQWTDGNTDNPRSVTATADVTYTAQFELEQFTISVETEDAAKGIVSVTKE